MIKLAFRPRSTFNKNIICFKSVWIENWEMRVNYIDWTSKHATTNEYIVSRQSTTISIGATHNHILCESNRFFVVCCCWFFAFFLSSRYFIYFSSDIFRSDGKDEIHFFRGQWFHIFRVVQLMVNIFWWHGRLVVFKNGKSIRFQTWWAWKIRETNIYTKIARNIKEIILSNEQTNER